MRSPVAFLAAAAAALSLSLAPARAETLSDALASAYVNSQLLEQNRALLRAVDENVAQALAKLRPVIDYALNWTRNEGPSRRNLFYATGVPSNPIGITSQTFNAVTITKTIAVTADLLIYDFGRSRMGVKAAQEAVLNAREQLRNIEQNVLLDAVTAYLAVIRTNQFVSLGEANVRLIGEELKAAQDRFDLGEVTVTDVSIAEASLAQARAQLASARGDLQVAREQYIATVGHPPGQLASPPSAPMTARSLDEAKSIGQHLHPTMLAAQYQVAVDELNIKMAQAAMLPALSAGAEVAVDEEGATSSTLNLRFAGPIYRGGSLSSTYRIAVANRDASRASLLQQGITVAENVGTAWAQRNVAQANYAASDDQIRAAKVAYDGVREEASLGARTTLDVLTAEQDLLDAQARKISAYSNFYVSTYQLLASMGLLTVDHLKLAVIQYDPEAYYNAVKNGPVRKVSPQGKKLDMVLMGLGKK